MGVNGLNRNRMTTATALIAAALLSAATLLSACSSGGTVTIVDSQTSDSQTTDYAIAFVKRSVPMTGTGATATMAQDDLRLPRAFFTKADLYLLNPQSSGGAEIDITKRVTHGGNYDIKDVDVNYDGSSIVFAMRGPVTAKQKDFDPPNWSIWEYVLASDYLHQICPTEDPTCSDAQYVSPHYLPDGRIVFATTRQFDSGAVLLNEGKPVFEAQTEDLNESGFELHVMNTDGSGMHQITFNQSHDIDATVLQNGRVMFTRWDDTDGNDSMNLYTANPDGTNIQLLYGYGSHETATTNPGAASSCPAGEDCTVEFTDAREMPDGRVLALVRPYTDADWGGNLDIIDVKDYLENNQANPDAPNNAGYSTTSVAEQPATQNEVVTACTNSCAATGDLPLISPGGRFTSAFPLWDGTGRILVTWSECRLQDKTGTIMPCTSDNLANTALTAAPVLYSAWMFDPSSNTFMPITTPTAGVFVDDIVSLQPRAASPAYIPDSYNTTTNPQGVLDIRSVYDWDGAACNGQNGESCNAAAAGGVAGMAQLAADQRPARFLRIIKAVSIPPTQAAKGQEALKFDRNTAFGSAGNYMREILGYVPIEPDGSVRVFVPSDIAFQIDVVDVQPNAADATYGSTGFIWRAFPRHSAWLQMQPGEELDCNGCHQPASQQRPPAGVSAYSHNANPSIASGLPPVFASIWSGATAGTPFPGTTGTISTCQTGYTMAETLYECPQSGATGPLPNAAALSVNVTFKDQWFGGGVGNEPINLTYNPPDGSFSTPVPTPLQCAVSGGDGGDDCRVVINYPSTPPMTATVGVPGNIEPLWDKCRASNAPTCAPTAPAGPGPGTCSACHNANTAATGYLDLADGASANNANQENSYQQLMNGFSVTTVDPVTGQTTTTQVRGAEFVSGNAAASHFFQFFTNPDATHAGLLSPAELRLLSEWVDIGAQYFNNPFNAPVN
jgi:Hydrazine synthase alpha subunit middle domain